MSGRRAGNRIRGPQSALTDFLAANNISARQIRDSYTARLQQANADGTDGDASAANGEPSGTNGNADHQEETSQQNEEDDEEERAAAEEAIERSKKRKRKSDKDGKKSKAAAKKKAKRKHGGSDDDDSDIDDLGKDMYKASKKLPGQLENCNTCGKRFTVTPYSKAGPDGGLLCTPCGKELAAADKKDAKAQKKPTVPKKRRKIESDRLDGIVTAGPKSLQQLCIDKVVQYHDDIDDLAFQDLPYTIFDRMSEIFSKNRVMNSKTMKLFIRPDLDVVAIPECAYLESDDYDQIFAVVPKLKKIALGNVTQFKDPNMEYMLEKAIDLKFIQLYGANLISNDMWIKLFKTAGPSLEHLKLKWLDASLDDTAVEAMVQNCPNLKRVKFKRCRKITESAVESLQHLKRLEHLSLQDIKEVSSVTLMSLLDKIGPRLKTLSLEHFPDADDDFLSILHDKCRSLEKLRFSENDMASDTAYASLFTDWKNDSLRFIDLNSTRDMDNSNPEGPEDPIGLADNGFKALMSHSGKDLQHLDIASCRHITLSAFLDVFDGQKQYPHLQKINISFCNTADTTVVAGIFKSCPSLKQVIAFGCFNIQDVVVPRGVVLIGVPRAQEAIEQFGDSWLNVDQALGKMLTAEA